MSQDLPLPPDAAKLKEELEAKAAEIRANAGVPAGAQIGAPPAPPVIQMPRKPLPPIPDHMGTVVRPEPPPLPNRERIELDAATGSELHIMSLQTQLLTKEAEKAALRQELAKREVSVAELEKQLIGEKLTAHQKLMAEKMRDGGVPEGWTFTRKPDGGYTLERPKPQAR